MEEELDPGSIRNTQPHNAMPFVVALVGFLIVAVLAFVFLREDDPGRLVRPDGVSVIGDDTIRLTVDGPFRKPYADVIKVGYALGEDDVFVEMVLDEYDCPDDTDCGASTESLTVDVVLPEPIDGRDVGPGTGRTLVDCDRDPGIPTCQ
ncbi:hypothetical protein [Actinospongicola halichondriae]|uniref:hypothetical protein n=1 Tax=Actinospongicola halichondriae TaxID=3236844 RepID=UPI003D444F15